jgi:hypothetical protein
MARIEKTVFISYRRSDVSWALAIFQSLTQHGYDVFFDFTGIGSGDFEGVILENITARAHFLILLTPSALERCSEPGDWLRREIEVAMSMGRNIVPLMFQGFDFGAAETAGRLTGKLAGLNRYNGLRVYAEYFTEAMDRLRRIYLNVPVDAVMHPASQSAQEAAKDDQVAARTAPQVQEQELTAQELFQRGWKAADSKDDAEAVKWFRKAADAGNPGGMNSLGFMYANGRGGLPKDDAQAVHWYRKAADAGIAAGMHNLGLMYENGLGGLPKDDAQAVQWYRKAADAGEAAGMHNLGVMY